LEELSLGSEVFAEYSVVGVSFQGEESA